MPTPWTEKYGTMGRDRMSGAEVEGQNVQDPYTTSGAEVEGQNVSVPYVVLSLK